MFSFKYRECDLNFEMYEINIFPYIFKYTIFDLLGYISLNVT